VPELSCAIADRARRAISGHPLLAVVLAGIILRLLITSLSMIYDTNYWALVIRNIDSGNGLYGLDGYFYTPVWGYLLALEEWFNDSFLNLGESAVRVSEIVYFENGDHQTTAMITSVAFGYLVKLPLALSDLILAWLCMGAVEDRTGDRKKAVRAFALVFLSATVLGSSAIIGMPDTVGAVFMMLCIRLTQKRLPVLAGICFSLSVLTKFFPFFIIFPLVGYILARDKDDVRRGMAQVALSAAGALIALAVVLAPQISDGTVGECFRFITDRMGISFGDSAGSRLAGAARVAVFIAIIAVACLVGRRAYREAVSSKDADRALYRYSLAMVSMCMLYPPATQYLVAVIPLLACCAAGGDRRLMASWKLLSIGAAVIFTVSLCTHLMPIAVWTDFLDVSSLAHWYDVWNAGPGVLSIWNAQFVIGSVIQYMGVLAALIVIFEAEVRRYLGGFGRRIADILGGGSDAHED
jgi:hypothetical protein